ncbi:MAG: hypothetical protein IT357_14495 [Gemmatimonadaceae bacterium]|nr:hypothetical protein [Gemmatimonadaceae bacterium]
MLALVALPSTVLVEFVARSVWPEPGALRYDWTLAEGLSAMAFTYVLSLPLFFAVGALHHVALVAIGARSRVLDHRAARVSAGVIAFAPLVVSALDDPHMVFALLVGATIYSIAAEVNRPGLAGNSTP